jgi:hypothetical protein
MPSTVKTAVLGIRDPLFFAASPGGKKESSTKLADF